MSDLTLVVGDTDPSVASTLSDPLTGQPFDLTGATVRFQMRPVLERQLMIDAIATVVNPTAGTVRYDWTPGDTDRAGDYVFHWKITFADGGIQHTLPANTLTIEVP